MTLINSGDATTDGDSAEDSREKDKPDGSPSDNVADEADESESAESKEEQETQEDDASSEDARRNYFASTK